MAVSRLWLCCALLGLTFAIANAPAHAFTVETIVTRGCHERITGAALSDVGWPEGATPPAPRGDDSAVLGDLAFHLPDGFGDIWTAALLLGVRSIDLSDESGSDLPELSQVHNDPGLQHEHCLRSPDQDGPEGDVTALATCHNFILTELALALGESDPLDIDQRERFEINLTFRGDVAVSLPGYPFHLGRALHALQDSYTHTFRNPDDLRVRHVLNWVEGNRGHDHDEARDGHRHVGVLDHCGGSGPGEQRRESGALQASVNVLRELANPTGGREGRLERVAQTLDRSLALEPGCVAENGWCAAEEPTLHDGCNAVGGVAGPAGSLLLLGALIRLRRRRRRRGTSAALALALVALLPSLARAQSSDEEKPPEEQRPEEWNASEEVKDRAEKRQLDRQERKLDKMPDPTRDLFGVAVHGAAAIDRAALAIGLGGRFSPIDRLSIGLDLEYNPWISLSAGEIGPGLVNLYVPVAWRLFQFGAWDVRTTARLGATYMLDELVGVERGQVGLFLGICPLGVGIPLGPDMKFVFMPGDIAVPIPRLAGIPFYYQQYRVTAMFEWYP